MQYIIYLYPFLGLHNKSVCGLFMFTEHEQTTYIVHVHFFTTMIYSRFEADLLFSPFFGNSSDRYQYQEAKEKFVKLDMKTINHLQMDVFGANKK